MLMVTALLASNGDQGFAPSFLLRVEFDDGRREADRPQDSQPLGRGHRDHRGGAAADVATRERAPRLVTATLRKIDGEDPGRAVLTLESIAVEDKSWCPGEDLNLHECYPTGT